LSRLTHDFQRGRTDGGEAHCQSGRRLGDVDDAEPAVALLQGEPTTVGDFVGETARLQVECVGIERRGDVVRLGDHTLVRHVLVPSHDAAANDLHDELRGGGRHDAQRAADVEGVISDAG